MSDKNIIIRPNPFPGLRAFRPDEGHLFFGRMESTIKVVNKLKDNRFVAVIGASGSGKSSLVFSGVIPALLKENAEGKKSWSYLTFKPGRNPVDNLATELAALSSGAGFLQLSGVSVAASLHNRTEGLNNVINRIRKNLRQQIVIVIDQFEETFRYGSADTLGTIGDNATDFIDLIVNAVQEPDQGLYILLTMRSEYVSECARFHSLTNLMNTSSYLLPQLSRDLLTSVIEEPIKVSGATIDRTLVRLILTDLEDKPGQLPVIQHLMMRLWNQWSRNGDMSRPISVADYDAVGQLKGAIAQHAGQALETLDERHRYVCSRLFRTITARSDDGREQRTPETISSIADQTGCTEQEIIRVAEVFRAPEYSFISPSKEIPLSGNSILDITHESIIRLWGTLRRWMDEEEASRKLYLQLAVSAGQYQNGNGKLWTAPDLLMAIKWKKENNPTLAWAEKIDPAFERTMLFLKNSEEEYLLQEEYRKKTGKERIRKYRMVAAIFGMLTLTALIAFGSIYSLRNRAEKQRSVAQQLKDEAVAVNNLLNDSLFNLTDTLKTVAEKAGIEKMNAMAAEDRAEQAEQRATVAERTANEMTLEKDAAVNKVTEENRQRMLSVAKSLAVRSINHQDDNDLQILMSWQAYIFNRRYSGASDDADLFSALYAIGKKYGNRYYSRFVPDGADLTAMTEDIHGQFYTADNSGRILRWKTSDPSMGYRVIWSGDKTVKTMAVSPDNEWLACGTETSEIIMIPIADDTIGYQLKDSCGTITALLFSADGQHLISSAYDGGVKEWNLTTRKNKEIINKKTEVTALDKSSDNTLIAALTGDGRVIIWQEKAPDHQTSLRIGARIITFHKFLPDRNSLATGDNNGNIDIWNISNQTVEGNIEGHLSAIRNIAFNKADGQMLSADDTGEIKLWTLADLEQPPVIFTDNEENIIRLSFSDEGNAFLSATTNDVTRRPAHVRCMTYGLCDKVSRNFTEQEWAAYVGSDIDYEPTCPDKALQIKVREIRGAR